MILEYSVKTDVGKVRKENQDSYGILEDKNFFFVCDGMGGQASGDFASHCAVEFILKSFNRISKEDISQVIGDSAPLLSEELLRPVTAIKLANRALFNFSDKYTKLGGMGTTLTGILFDTKEELLHIYHAGDSRVYRIRNGVIEQLTRDHSKVNELIELGKMSKEDAKTAEIQSMITRALGIKPNIKVDYRVEPVLSNDYFVICSDGLNSELDDNEINRIVISNQDNINKITENLVNSAISSGGKDNVTVVTIKAKNVNPEKVREKSKYSDAIIIDEENQEQTVSEDRILLRLLNKIKIDVPKSVKERSLIGGALFWAVLLTVLIFGVIFLINEKNSQRPDTELVDLTGQVCGIQVNIRTPMQQYLEEFIEEEDKIQRLQIVQDWYNNIENYTAPLKNVEILVKKDNQEKFGTIAGAKPVEIDLERGMYSINASYHNYRIIMPNLKYQNNYSVTVEMASSLKKIYLIMIPQE